MTPYDPNPYRNTSNTGLSEMLAQANKQNREAAESARIDRMMMDVRELRYKVDELDHKIYGPRFSDISMTPYGEVDEPEPSVEEHDYTPGWWSRFFSDPFWEIFKRPSIK